MLRVAKIDRNTVVPVAFGLCVCLCACSLFLALPVDAQNQPGGVSGASATQGDASATEGTAKQDKEAEKPEEKVQTGVIATTGNFGFGNTNVDSDSSGAAPGDEAGIITASVSKVGRDKCQVKVTNTSEENGYSVSYRVNGRNDKGSKVFSKGFSRSLKAGESHDREFRCNQKWRLEVNLSSARKRS